MYLGDCGVVVSVSLFVFFLSLLLKVHFDFLCCALCFGVLTIDKHCFCQVSLTFCFVNSFRSYVSSRCVQVEVKNFWPVSILIFKRKVIVEMHTCKLCVYMNHDCIVKPGQTFNTLFMDLDDLKCSYA